MFYDDLFDFNSSIHLYYRIVFPKAITTLNGSNVLKPTSSNSINFFCRIIDRNSNTTRKILDNLKYPFDPLSYEVRAFALTSVEDYTKGLFKSHEIDSDVLNLKNSSNDLVSSSYQSSSNSWKINFNDAGFNQFFGNLKADVNRNKLIWAPVIDYNKQLTIIDNTIHLKLLLFEKDNLILKDSNELDPKSHGRNKCKVTTFKPPQLFNTSTKYPSSRDCSSTEGIHSPVVSCPENFPRYSPEATNYSREPETVSSTIVEEDRRGCREWTNFDDFFNFDAPAAYRRSPVEVSSLSVERQEICDKIRKWSHTLSNQLKDIRSLLATLDHVLWEDIEWQPVPMGLLVGDEESVKKYYRRALLVCHPDKQKVTTWQRKLESELITQTLQDARNNL